MPFYQYEHSCGYSEMLRRRVGEHVLQWCPECGATVELRPVINRATAPNVMLPSVSNHYYNNGMGKYDAGLGAYVHSREEHRELMREQGVTEFQGTEDDFMAAATQEQEFKGPDIEHIKDTMLREANEVKQGKTWKDKPNPNPDITPTEI